MAKQTYIAECDLCPEQLPTNYESREDVLKDFPKNKTFFCKNCQKLPKGFKVSTKARRKHLKFCSGNHNNLSINPAIVEDRFWLVCSAGKIEDDGMPRVNCLNCNKQPC